MRYARLAGHNRRKAMDLLEEYDSSCTGAKDGKW